MAPDDQQVVAEPAVTPEVPSQDDQEWEQAAQDFKSEVGIKEEAKPNEAPKVQEDSKTPAEGGAEAVTPPEGDLAPEATPEPTPQDTTVRDQRAIQREIIEDQKAMKEDIRNEMFKDAAPQLLDKDGDPINAPEDLLKIINPNTGEPFTAQEATAYFLQWRMDADKKVEDVEKQIEQIADVQLSIKDQADNVLTKYGALLKEKPELGKMLWDTYAETLEKNEESGIITRAPQSLERFADIALSGHQEAFEARQAAAQPPAPTPEAVQQQEKQKEVVKKQTRSDREDIFSGGKTETMDAEEKEWAKAAKEHYEGN